MGFGQLLRYSWRPIDRTSVINAPSRADLDDLCAQPLISKLYTSRASSRFGPADLAPMLKVSRAKNWLRNLTGILLYQDGRFLHYLEGPADDVDERMGRIRVDPRHFQITMLAEQQPAARLFPRWTMAFTSLTEADRTIPGLHAVFAGLDSSTDTAATTAAVARLAEWFAEQHR